MAVVLTLRAVKGSALTNTEMDTNLSNLKAASDAVSAAEFADATVSGAAGADTGNYLRIKVGATFYKIPLLADA
jgi:hypothetical protein